MTKFITYIVVTTILFFMLLELTLRVLGLAGHTIPTTIINKNIMSKPYSESTWVKGNFREIVSHYKINEQGFNSLIDYSAPTGDKLRVAIIGDSYIEGFQSDVEHSIGRQLEKFMDNTVVVHEFGRSSAGIVDYALAYQQMVKDRYDHVFILISDNNLNAKKARYMNIAKTANIKKMPILSRIYENSHTLRYLNINLGLRSNLTQVVNAPPKSIERIHKNSALNKIQNYNRKSFSVLDEDVVILYETERLSKSFLDTVALRTLKIKHTQLPKDHGFDKHWNNLGRSNVASTIKNFIETH